MEAILQWGHAECFFVMYRNGISKFSFLQKPNYLQCYEEISAACVSLLAYNLQYSCTGLATISHLGYNHSNFIAGIQ